MLQSLTPALPVIFIILMLPGLLFSLVPMMPAFPYMFLLAAIFGFVDKFIRITGTELAILGGIFGASLIVDYTAGIIGAKYGGASRKGIFWGFVGLILGILIMPPFGGFLGLFLGVFIAEWLRKHDKNKALKAATGSVVGAFSGVVVNIFLAIAFVALFAIFIYR
ncbi:MAG: DUF456 domain-containing protein [Candidatus Pacebacteria bacterium]|nr:DUF456 domain-containing protein [Candidatus Paceibacterota bacterium]NUQ57679.1 DUF456 domain-containing protein [Candidatus Paceibacter sp.]